MIDNITMLVTDHKGQTREFNAVYDSGYKSYRLLMWLPTTTIHGITHQAQQFPVGEYDTLDQVISKVNEKVEAGF